MHGTRDFDGAPEPGPLVVEWVPHSSDEPELAIEIDSRQSSSIVRMVAILALGIAAIGLFVAGLESESTRSARDEASDDPAPEAAPVTPPSSLPIVVDEIPAIDQLDSAPLDWAANQVIALVDESGQLRVRALDTGEDLDVGVLAATNLPPLADHVHLLGAPGSTWLLDLEEPERSGKLSNTVRIVRLGTGLDSYGFSSPTDVGTIEFFLGSLWGPAMNGLAEVDADATVFYVPGRGIIASRRDGASSVLGASGFEPMPPRLGRIVAATPTHVAGIHCDDLGRCVGRVARWDGTDEHQVDAGLLALPLVRLAPDGRSVLAAGASLWNLIDVNSGAIARWDIRVPPNDSLVWSQDSSTVFFVADGSVVAIRPLDLDRPVALVRRAGFLDDRLADSDVGIFTYEG